MQGAAIYIYLARKGVVVNGAAAICWGLSRRRVASSGSCGFPSFRSLIDEGKREGPPVTSRAPGVVIPHLSIDTAPPSVVAEITLVEWPNVVVWS